METGPSFWFPTSRSCRSRPRGRATGLVLGVREPSRDPNSAGMVRRIMRFGLSDGAMVGLAGNTINSTRLALNSFPKSPQLGVDLAGKNLMVHVRGNYAWRIRKSALQLPATSDLGTSALQVEGRVPVGPPANRLGASISSSMRSAAATTTTRNICIA